MKDESSDIELSIILVNYKTPELLFNCIHSIITNEQNIRFEIITVDNNSQDHSEKLIKESFPSVRWINMGYNSGFARANNEGIKHAIGKYILVLNSDTVINDETLIKSLNHYKELEKRHKIGFLGCKLIHFEGADQFNSRIKAENISKIIQANPITIKLNKIWGVKQDKKQSREDLIQLHNTAHQTIWLGGTFLLYNAKISKEDGHYLDEDFFMYGEDIEWCLRLNKYNYKHFYFPEASVLHAEGGSFKIKENKILQINLSEWLLIMKVYGKFIFIPVALYHLLGLWLDNILSNKIELNEEQNVLNEIRKKTISLYKRYFFKILFYYSQKPSSQKNFLKYDAIQ